MSDDTEKTEEQQATISCNEMLPAPLPAELDTERPAWTPTFKFFAVSYLDRAQQQFEELMSSLPSGLKLERATLSNVRDLDERVAFIMGELEFLKRDLDYVPEERANAATIPCPPPGEASEGGDVLDRIEKELLGVD